jgi:hypothetical protein
MQVRVTFYRLAICINIEPIKPRGNERTGSFASSAASGTPSTARKNQSIALVVFIVAMLPHFDSARLFDIPVSSHAGASNFLPFQT